MPPGAVSGPPGSALESGGQSAREAGRLRGAGVTLRHDRALRSLLQIPGRRRSRRSLRRRGRRDRRRRTAARRSGTGLGGRYLLLDQRGGIPAAARRPGRRLPPSVGRRGDRGRRPSRRRGRPGAVGRGLRSGGRRALDPGPERRRGAGARRPYRRHAPADQRRGHGDLQRPGVRGRADREQRLRRAAQGHRPFRGRTRQPRADPDPGPRPCRRARHHGQRAGDPQRDPAARPLFPQQRDRRRRRLRHGGAGLAGLRDRYPGEAGAGDLAVAAGRPADAGQQARKARRTGRAFTGLRDRHGLPSWRRREVRSVPGRCRRGASPVFARPSGRRPPWRCRRPGSSPDGRGRR